MVFRTKSGLRPTTASSTQNIILNTGFCRCPWTLVILWRIWWLIVAREHTTPNRSSSINGSPQGKRSAANLTESCSKSHRGSKKNIFLQLWDFCHRFCWISHAPAWFNLPPRVLTTSPKNFSGYIPVVPWCKEAVAPTGPPTTDGGGSPRNKSHKAIHRPEGAAESALIFSL